MLQVTGDPREEVEVVLTSATFSRTPRVAKLLRYLLEKAQTKQADRISEYDIAVELLGRPASFVPSEDAIVRVEIHRLRKKLKEFYETEGASRPFRLVIPSGTYVPQLVPDQPGQITPEPAIDEAPPPPAPSQTAHQVAASPQPAEPRGAGFARWQRAPYLLAGAVGVVLGLSAMPAVRFFSSSSSAQASNLTAGAALEMSATAATREDLDRFGKLTPAPGPAFRFLAGRKIGFTDTDGRAWGPDQFATGGTVVEAPAAGEPRSIARTREPRIYQGARKGNFTYDIPLSTGTYEMRLHFSESEFGPGKPKGGGETSRVFHIAANQQRILSDFDIYACAGSDTADEMVFKDVSPSGDGMLHLRFISQQDQALLNAIEILPARPHQINPIRIASINKAYTDVRGNMWLPERYRSGGRVSTGRTAPVQGTDDKDLFKAEIYGNIQFALPVAANGIYDILIYLAETYWGPENDGGGGAGTRVFDILCNGAALTRNMDVFSRVGANRALVMRYSGLKPDSCGKLRVSLQPVHNYGSIFAIEAHDMSK